MAYRGVQSIGDTGLESVRRIRESAEGGPGSGPRPGSGPKTRAFDKAEKIVLDRLRKNPNDKEAQQAISALTRLRKTQVGESVEGGPGSGPRPGRGGKGPKNYQSHDYKKQSAEFKRQHGDISTSPGQGQKTKPGQGGGRFGEKRVQLLSKEFKSLPRSDQRLLRPKIKEMVGRAFNLQERTPGKAAMILDRAFDLVKRFKDLSGEKIQL